MKIELFGPGCPKCQELEKAVRGVVTELNIVAEIDKVKDIMKIVEAGVMMPPAIRINGKMRCSGRVPKAEEIKKWLGEEK